MQIYPSEDDEIAAICTQIQQRCSGKYAQYNSTTDCIRYMKSIPYGSWDLADQNNFICRCG